MVVGWPAWLAGCLGIWLSGKLAVWFLTVWLSVFLTLWLAGVVGWPGWLAGCMAGWQAGCLVIWLSSCLSFWLSGWRGWWADLDVCLSVCLAGSGVWLVWLSRCDGMHCEVLAKQYVCVQGKPGFEAQPIWQWQVLSEKLIFKLIYCSPKVLIWSKLDAVA